MFSVLNPILGRARVDALGVVDVSADGTAPVLVAVGGEDDGEPVTIHFVRDCVPEPRHGRLTDISLPCEPVASCDAAPCRRSILHVSDH